MTLNYLHAILHLRPGAQVAIVGGLAYENIEWGTEPPIPQAELDAALPAAQAAHNNAESDKKTKAELLALDMASIRALREGDATRIAQLNAEAAATRGKLRKG